MSTSWPVAEVADGYGYRVTMADLDFLDISDTSFDSFCRRELPLGMTESHYQLFAASLSGALVSDGIDRFDVRLQGSSAGFFSGHHKVMPWERQALIEEFRQNRHRVPRLAEVDDAVRTMQSVWPDSETRPTRRPFDSMYRLGLDRMPSDYDVQIASTQIVERASAHILELGVPADRLTIHSEHYAFVRKDLVELTCPALYLWSLEMSDVLRRNVTIAVFADGGPPQTASVLSAHFRDSDWILLRREGQ